MWIVVFGLRERKRATTMTNYSRAKTAPIVALSFVLALGAPSTLAQDDSDATLSDDTPDVAVAETDPDSIEELVIVGRLYDAAKDVVSERMDRDVPVDFVDSESISRVGDSDVASALRRLPGLTLVEDKFVYVRGLGERYSSAQLNGSVVPSPDITRNVLPLDIFPADLVESLAVHKGFAPELTASFGGGSVDIRTKKIPESFVLSAELKTGWSSAGRNGLTYPGGSNDRWGSDDETRALPANLESAIETFRGNFTPLNIWRTVVNGPVPRSIEDARVVNRSLATYLNRDIDLEPKELANDLEGDFLVGQRIYFTDQWDVGMMMLGSYSNDWRLKERINRRITNPNTDYSETRRTVNEVDVTLSLNAGTRITDDHEIGAMAMLLRNTEDDAATTRTCVQGQFNDCLDTGSPVQGRIYSIRFEQRELELKQIDGSHTLGLDTIDRLPNALLFLDRIEDSKLTWYYTDAVATTSIPNEVRIGGQEPLDGPNGNPEEFRIRSTGSAADFRFSDLEDQAESYGWDISVPFIGVVFDLELSGGYDYLRKVRNYKQVSLGLGSTDASFRSVSAGSPSEVFSDENIMNPELNINLLLGVGEFGSESYIAANVVEGGYGKFDLFFQEKWRLSGGVRKEVFTQFSLPVDYLEFDSSRVGLNTEEDVNAFVETILQSEEFYPSLALTRSMDGLWDTEQVQLRFVVSRTVARPDIRETSASTYIDPITEARVRGNPELDVSDLTNFDFRFELFWLNGDNLTTSLFYKDIEQPIETVQGGATEDNVRFNFVNAESAYVYGIEVEWLKSLGFARAFLGDWTDLFYFSGNGTLSTSEINIPPGAGVGNITNQTRRMTQQSNWVANFQLGFDSTDTKHAATIVYNAFGERIYFAGIDGLPDGYEQPFHGLDVVYSWYPTNNVTVKARVKNILNSSVKVEQGDVSIIEQTIGSTVLINVSWDL